MSHWIRINREHIYEFVDGELFPHHDTRCGVDERVSVAPPSMDALLDSEAARLGAAMDSGFAGNCGNGFLPREGPGTGGCVASVVVLLSGIPGGAECTAHSSENEEDDWSAFGHRFAHMSDVRSDVDVRCAPDLP